LSCTITKPSHNFNFLFSQTDAHTHCTLYTLNRLGVHQLAALHPGVLERAIALHYAQSSPMGKRTSLVFGRRASVDQFRADQAKAAMGVEGMSHMLEPSRTSPAGAAFIALETVDDPMLHAARYLHEQQLAPTKNLTSVTTTKSSTSPLRRRQSQSMLGLEFRFQLVLNTLHLEGEAYQFALLGCEKAEDVEHLKFEDLTNINKMTFNRLQKMCETHDNDNDGNDSEEDEGEEKGEL